MKPLLPSSLILHSPPLLILLLFSLLIKMSLRLLHSMSLQDTITHYTFRLPLFLLLSFPFICYLLHSFDFFILLAMPNIPLFFQPHSTCSKNYPPLLYFLSVPFYSFPILLFIYPLLPLLSLLYYSSTPSICKTNHNLLSFHLSSTPHFSSNSFNKFLHLLHSLALFSFISPVFYSFHFSFF